MLIDDERAADNILNTEVENLDLLPSNIDLAGAEVELVYKPRREKVLKSALEEEKGKYDYIMIDCPPSLGLLTINALCRVRFGHHPHSEASTTLSKACPS